MIMDGKTVAAAEEEEMFGLGIFEGQPAELIVLIEQAFDLGGNSLERLRPDAPSADQLNRDEPG